MNRLNKTTILAAAAALFTQAAQANPDDLILNFSSVGVSYDYTINLGNATTSVGINGSSVVDLSALFNVNTYNSAFSSAVNPVMMGVIGGGGVGAAGDLYVSQLRDSVTHLDFDGNAQVGSILGGQTTVAQGSGQAIANGIPEGLVLQSNPQSWTSQAVSWQNAVGINPQSSISGSIITEDLYQAVNVLVGSGRTAHFEGTWDYMGYLSLNLGNDTLTFTPEIVAVPEPATYGLLVGAGLLALSLRRQLTPTKNK